MSQTVKLRRSATSGSVPTTSALALGELAINTYDGKLYLKKSVSGTESIVEIGANNLADTFHVYEYSVTANTTVFQGSDDNSHTLSYTTGSPPRLAVYLNGLLLDWGTDFTATNGTSVTLSSAAVSGDLVQIQAYKSTVVAGSNLMFGDNIKAQFGDDGDLEIYHDGSNSIINDIGTGNLQFQIGGSLIYSTTTDGIVLNNGLDVEANEFIGDLRGAVLFKAQAGEALSKGDVVYISGINGNTTIVSKADADDANKMPAFGVAATAITSGSTGDIYTFGTLSGLDTSSFTLGDELYVSTTAGALTNSAPTGSSAQIQKIAKVTRSDNSAGSIKIMGAGRSNATPNLDEGKIFVGNASNQSVQVDSTITVDMANSQVLVDGALSVEGGSFASNLETATDAGLVIQKGDYIYSDDNNYLRKIIGHTAANHIEIGQTGTALIGDINIRPGSTGNIKLFGSGSEDFKVDSSGNTTMNGTATINNAVTGDASQFTIVNGAGATLRMGITGSGANEAAHIKTNAGEALEFHIGQASDATTPDIEFLADGAGIDFQGVNILNSSRNMTTNSRFTFDYNDHYLEAGTNSLSLKNSGGTSYFVASNTGLSVTGTLSSTGDLTVGGNLTVNGTTTTLNTATLDVEDKNITLNKGSGDTSSTADGAGITVQDAVNSTTDATLLWAATPDAWQFSHRLYAPNYVVTDTNAIIYRNSNDLELKTYAGYDINLMPAGNVGVNEITPLAKMEVAGSIKATSRDTNHTSEAGVTLSYDTSDSIALLETWTSKPLLTRTYNYQAFDISGTEMMRINSNGIGIGTDAPLHKLAIGGNSTQTLKSTVAITDMTNGASLALRGQAPTIFFDSTSGGIPTLLMDGKGIEFKDGTLDNQGNVDVKIDATGNVGIGESPRFKLSVKTPAILSGSTYAWPLDLSRPNTENRGLTFGVAASGTTNAIAGHNADVSIGHTYGTDSNGLPQYYETLRVKHIDQASGQVGIGTDNPNTKLHVYDNVNRTSAKVQNNNHSAIFEAYGTATAIDTDASNGIFLRISGANKVHLDNNGNFGVNVTDPKAKFQVEEYGIDTTETSTSATTQTVIHTMSASDFRSARFTIQVTNSTDSTYHTTEILMVHDGTNANITEFGKVYTANEEATFDADVSAGNVRLFATPATTDSMEFKVVCHSITV